ncbi:MAG: MBL fold metallo-hydrolase [Erysipelotrichaceae bacterium]|nr:MBL fold metallo-hydrolase [Erysipelotrichaceae bacterium]
MEKVIKLVLSMMQTNCYLIKENGHVLIVDPASSPNRILSMIEEDEVVDGILLTHGHFDHIGAADALKKKLHCPIYVHEYDKRLATDVKIDRFMSDVVVKSELSFYRDGINQIGSFKLDVLHTPGHTDGSVCIGYKNHLFTGDTLFQCSVGRTDLYSGSDSKLKQSLHRLCSLHPETLIYPGHGECSVLEFELKHNPYLY